MTKVKWLIYEPSWLIEIVKEQRPEEKGIIENLKKCTRCFKKTRAYYYFIYSETPNTPESDWQFERSITLHSKEYGKIMLDVLKGNEIGGIEFLDRLG